MKALVLVGHLSTTDFKILINTDYQEMQGFSLHLTLQNLNRVVYPL